MLGIYYDMKTHKQKLSHYNCYTENLQAKNSPIIIVIQKTYKRKTLPL